MVAPRRPWWSAFCRHGGGDSASHRLLEPSAGSRESVEGYALNARQNGKSPQYVRMGVRRLWRSRSVPGHTASGRPPGAWSAPGKCHRGLERHHEGERRCLEVFVISNAGPGAIEWDLGHHQWSDLNPSDSFSGAFVMRGNSGRLAPGEVDSFEFPRPTRPNGTWRYVVPCRRAQGLTERLRERVRDRLPRWIPEPDEMRQVWMAASPWTEVDKP